MTAYANMRRGFTLGSGGEEESEGKKKQLSVILLGHSACGKSTMLGRIISVEPIAKGLVELGWAIRKTENTIFTFMDNPGERDVSAVVREAFEADIGVLVVSAQGDEFERGYGRGGLTREHAQLAKSCGVLKMVVVVNKMDTVFWSQDRFDQIKEEIVPFLTSLGYEDVECLPVSGLLGINMVETVGQAVCPWWNGTHFFQVMESVDVVPPGDPNGPFRMPIFAKLLDEEENRTLIRGRVESGTTIMHPKTGDGEICLLRPDRGAVKVLSLYRESDKVNRGEPRDDLTAHLSFGDIDDNKESLTGLVLSCVGVQKVPVVRHFFANLKFRQQPDKTLYAAGYKGILHVHAAEKECEIGDVSAYSEGKTALMFYRDQWRDRTFPFVKGGESAICKIEVCERICLEKFSNFPRLGSVVIRSTEGHTIAEGKVVELDLQMNVRDISFIDSTE